MQDFSDQAEFVTLPYESITAITQHIKVIGILVSLLSFEFELCKVNNHVLLISMSQT